MNYSVQLLTYCTANGKGTPKFSYCRMLNGNYKAKLIMADGREIVGDEAASKREASEIAAKIFIDQMTKGQSSQSNPAITGFPSPPKQWFQDGNSTQGQFVPLQAVRGKGRSTHSETKTVPLQKPIPTPLQSNNQQVRKIIFNILVNIPMMLLYIQKYVCNFVFIMLGRFDKFIDSFYSVYVTSFIII